MVRIFLLVALGSFCLGSAHAAALFEDFPGEIDPEGDYVFYSHGLIVEGDDPTPRHPSWGVYEFPDIAKALAASDFNVVAHHRPADTDPKAYAAALAQRVRNLIGAGVKPGSITLIGFSRGGQITAYASHALRATPVNTIILAACWDWIDREREIEFSGHVLSIYETSDSVGSCKGLADRSRALKSFQELAISTGEEHGAFYRPLPEWIEPVRSWIEARRP